jgi:hypothetical protein
MLPTSSTIGDHTMSRMTARYPGTCRKTGATIAPGDIIDYNRATRSTVLVMRANPDGTAPSDYPADVALAASIDPELAASDPETVAHAGRYLRASMARGVSTIWTSGGREFYRNRRGLCEDAPCCGCCNA